MKTDLELVAVTAGTTNEESKGFSLPVPEGHRAKHYTCPKCKGGGCPRCNGSGQLRRLILVSVVGALVDVGGDPTVDLSRFEELEPGVFRLPDFLEGVDYRDLRKKTGGGAWSIGRNEAGEIRAALDGRFYQAAGWSCLWLR